MARVIILLCLIVDLVLVLCQNETTHFRIKRDINKIFHGAYNRYIEKPRYLDKYDFIIVGSGPGGCALANRLTENLNWKVLVVEAGDVETPLQGVPLMAPYQTFTKFNWGYNAEPQSKACLGRQDNICPYPRGKALGGSTVINAMLHTRGNRRDFDRWAEAGNYGWSYQDVLPYFIKSEKANIGKFSDSPYHNRNGPYSVSFASASSQTGEAFIKANKILGMREIDYNGEESLGVAYVQSNTLNGRRHSTYRAFIEPVLRRPNLHIMLNTKVTRILIDPATKTAFGVELVRHNSKRRVIAIKEVILSSGAFHSPQLLTLSGIGLHKDLSRIGVPVIQELPVGYNMHDHPTFSELFFITNVTSNYFNPVTIGNLLLEFSQGRGLLALPGGAEALSFITTPTPNSRGKNVPDIELILAPGSLAVDRGFGVINAGRLKREIYDVVYKPVERTKYFTFIISLLLFHAGSIGRVEINDPNPFSAPKLHGNYFQDPNDIESLLHGVRYALKLIQTEPFRRLGVRLHDIPNPYCKHIHFGSDDYWRCVLRVMSFSIQHQAGTCKMGPASDRSAVVSPELKVHGIQKLRVVDTSVIPESPSAHTNAISVMLGEKTADMIKREWRNY